MKRLLLIVLVLLPLFGLAQDLKHEIGLSPIRVALFSSANNLVVGPELRYRYHVGNAAFRANASWNRNRNNQVFRDAELSANTISHQYRLNLGVQYGFQYGEDVFFYGFKDTGPRYVDVESDILSRGNVIQTELFLLGFGLDAGLGIDWRITAHLHLSLELSSTLFMGFSQGTGFIFDGNDIVETRAIEQLQSSFGLLNLSGLALSYRF